MEQIPTPLLGQEFDPAPPELGELPRDYEKRVVGTLHSVGRKFDDNFGPARSQPDPEAPDVFRIYPYGTYGEPHSAIKITPLSGDFTDEYQLMATPTAVFSRKRRAVGDKEWQDMPDDEPIPQQYWQAIFHADKQLPKWQAERAEFRRNAPKRGFFKWLIRR